jgi:hypothetical protein
VFVAEADGFFAPDATIEDVAVYCARMGQGEGFTTPRGVPDASALISKAIHG